MPVAMPIRRDAPAAALAARAERRSLLGRRNRQSMTSKASRNGRVAPRLKEPGSCRKSAHVMTQEMQSANG